MFTRRCSLAAQQPLHCADCCCAEDDQAGIPKNSALRRRFRSSRLHQGKHLLGHQDHRGAGQFRVFPVNTGVQQGTELAGLALERVQLVGHLRG